MDTFLRSNSAFFLASQIGSTLKGKNLLQKEQIHSFNSKTYLRKGIKEEATKVVSLSKHRGREYFFMLE